MSANITDPARGGEILEWARGVTETCRRFGGVGSANLLLRDGVGGVGFESLPGNSKGRKANPPPPGLFEPRIETDEEDEETKTVTFEYPYYMVGTRLYRCEDEDVTLTAEAGVYCLEINLSGSSPDGSVVRYDTFAQIQTRARQPGVSVKPLFEFGEGATVKRDFRNMPTFATQEFEQ